MNERELVDLLRLVRHDTLNQIQLLQGYLTLGRTEKVRQLLDEWIKNAREEANLSNLNCPRMATFFLTYKFQDYSPILHFTVKGEGKFSDEQDCIFSTWFKRFFDRIEQLVTKGKENYIKVAIEMQPEPVFYITWSGETFTKDDFQELFQEQHEVLLSQTDFAENYFFLELTI